MLERGRYWSARLVVLAVIVGMAAPAYAQVQVEKTAPERFLVTVQGGAGLKRLMKLAEESALALCMAAEFTHLRFLDRKASKGDGVAKQLVTPAWDIEPSAAGVEVQLLDGSDEGSVECRGASPKNVKKMRKRLDILGYRRPTDSAN